MTRSLLVSSLAMLDRFESGFEIPRLGCTSAHHPASGQDMVSLRHRQARGQTLLVALVWLTLVIGCDSAEFDVVASQAIQGGAISLWAPDGKLHAGVNRIVVDISGEAGGRIQLPPRLRFRKPVGGSGFPLACEARLGASRPGRFSGEIEFQEPGPWQGKFEVLGETVAFDIEVE